MTTMERPKDFDARVVAYLPGLRKQAGKYYRKSEDREDLVSATVEYALKTWRDFRPDGALWLWLRWRMRYVFSRRKRTAKALMRSGIGITLDCLPDVLEPPRQEDYAALSYALSSVKDGRDRDIVLRYALGETSKDIGAKHGIGQERVRQIVRATRATLRAAA